MKKNRTKNIIQFLKSNKPHADPAYFEMIHAERIYILFI